MKKILKLALPVVIVVGLFFGIKSLTDKKPVEGQKSVVINVKVKQEDETLEMIKEVKHTSVDSETVGDIIDEINGDLLNVELEGDKTSEFGRFILAIEDYKTEDMATGPWWMIYSENNKDCVEAGFCSGIDQQNVYDEDVFDLVFE